MAAGGRLSLAIPDLTSSHTFVFRHTAGRLLPFGATGVKAVNQEFRLEALFLAVR